MSIVKSSQEKIDLRPVLCKIHHVIKGTTQDIVLFKNNSYALLDKDENLDELIAKTKFDSTKVKKMAHVNFHVLDRHTICIVLDPNYPQFGNMITFPKTAQKKSNKVYEQYKTVGLENMKKDILEKEVLIDSRETNLIQYALDHEKIEKPIQKILQ